jgi:(p)ppGpp synthase/HD superfamily hydrolase
MLERSEVEVVHDLMRAACFAAVKHCNQRRKGAAAEPYINHLLEVAELVSGALSEPDTDLVMAALLHDTIEDSGVTKTELAERFGTEVAGLVAECTDDKSLPKQERKRLQVVNAPHKSVRAQAIKLADKTSNLRCILSSPPADWDFERKRDYFAWAKQVVDGFTAPNPILRAEFDRTHGKFADFVQQPAGGKPPHSGDS